MDTDGNYLLEMDDIHKSFAGVAALRGVHFELREHEIHALVGANGAGKSTLMKVLAGLYPDYQGTIRLNQRTVHCAHPRQALNLGIAVIYQEFFLAPQLTVAENILLGREPVRRICGIPFTNWGKLWQDAAELLDGLNFRLPLKAKVADLGVADQQLVQIAKAMAAQARILVMDEPTARLSRRERDQLFATMRHLKDCGTSIIYISHFLEEVFLIADRVTVLRDGRHVETRPTRELNHGRLVKAMLGREVVADDYRSNHPTDDVLLSLAHFSGERFHDISFALAKGEILGIAGLVGSGRTELARAIFGADRQSRFHGQIQIKNEAYHVKTPRHAIARGIALAPEDRKQQGLILVRPVADNILLPVTGRLRCGPLMNLRARRLLIAELISRLNIKCASASVLAGTLSGGNQQKVVLAKWLSTQSQILILDQPTAGIDVGTKEEIYHLLSQLAQEGAGLLVISDDPEELARVCERVLIMRKGRIVRELKGRPTSEEVLAAITADY